MKLLPVNFKVLDEPIYRPAVSVLKLKVIIMASIIMFIYITFIGCFLGRVIIPCPS